MQNLTFPKCTFSSLYCLISAFIFCIVLAQVQGVSKCTDETNTGIFGGKESYTCPKSDDPKDFVHCCGSSDETKCCKNPFGLDDEDMEFIQNNLAIIFAAVVGFIGFIVVACLLCCFFCSCCLLYKRRHGGAVYQAASQNATATTAPGLGSYPRQPNANPSQPYYPGAQPSYPGAQPSYGYDAQGNVVVPLQPMNASKQ